MYHFEEQCTLRYGEEQYTVSDFVILVEAGIQCLVIPAKAGIQYLPG